MKKISKIAAMTLLCSLALFFAAPEFTISASAATPPKEETVQPCADVLRWVFKIEDNKLYKRLYNTSTFNWVGDWIYLHDIEDNGK